MDDLAIGSVVLGAYRIEHIFTGGGMGVVYRARHLVWDIDLAIKHPKAKYLQSTEQRREFVNVLDANEPRMRALNKALYSTYRDCVDAGVGEEAKLLIAQQQQN